jgi:GDSL-like Lipase/Acylhydrolase family
MYLLASAACLFVGYCFLTEQIFRYQELIVFIYLARIFLVISSSVLIFLYLKQVFHRQPAASAKKGALVFIFVLVTLFNVTELVFMFIPKSQGPDMAYSSRIWFGYHWKTNAEGYREKALDNFNPNSSKIVFLGDSYTAGHGIDHLADRVSGIVQRQVPENYECINLGRNGMNTLDEIGQYSTLPVRPEIIVLGHVLNDVDYLLQTANPFLFRQFSNQNKTEQRLNALGRISFTFNFLYWHYKAHQNYRQVQKEQKEKQTAQPGITVNDLLKDVYEPVYNDSLLSIHIQNLEKIYDRFRGDSVKYIIMLYPDLIDLTLRSNVVAVNRKLGLALKARGIAYIDLTPLAFRLPEKQRMVNNIDAHPSPRMNHLFADSLVQHLRGIHWLK